MGCSTNCGMVSKVFCLLVVIGALNWGLMGLGHFLNFDGNVVHMLLGGSAAVEHIVYILVGVGGVMALMCHFKK